MKLCVPRICCEYNDALFQIMSSTNQRATLSCASFWAGNDALYNQPKAFELSVKASTLRGTGECRMDRCIVIADAINSSKLMVNFP